MPRPFIQSPRGFGTATLRPECAWTWPLGGMLRAPSSAPVETGAEAGRPCGNRTAAQVEMRSMPATFPVPSGDDADARRQDPERARAFARRIECDGYSAGPRGPARGGGMREPG